MNNQDFIPTIIHMCNGGIHIIQAGPTLMNNTDFNMEAECYDRLSDDETSTTLLKATPEVFRALRAVLPNYKEMLDVAERQVTINMTPLF